MGDRFHDPIISSVPYEVVTPGPAGRLVEILDFDSGTNQWLPLLDLDSAEVLITQGLTPSERDLRSHQQMVYAVSMRLLEAFERGLGRPFAWLEPLQFFPHSFEAANAYFQPDPASVHFGYFTANEPDPERGNLEGQRIFTSLSYDLIAGMLGSAVLTELRPTDQGSTDRDVVAFYPGMCDLIAILLRFSEPDVVA